MKNKKRLFAAVATVLAVVAVYTVDWRFAMEYLGIYAPINKGMSVTFIDVGKADAAFITAEGYNILVDAGVDMGADDIKAFLDRYEIDTLHMVIASHSDTDHIGGMSTIVENYDVEQFVTYDVEKKYESTSDTYTALKDTLKKKDVNITYTQAGDSYTFGSMRIDVLSPNHEYCDSNDDSVVVKIVYDKTEVLFTGDISEKVEEYLLENRVDVKCDVLKVSHHGSNKGTTEDFLKAADPEYAIISVGSNTNNLPGIDVVNRLKNYQHLNLYRTDYHGDITINSDGKKITVTTEK